MAEIKEEETQVLWDYYKVHEEEGLDRFDNTLTKHSEFNKGIANSE